MDNYGKKGINMQFNRSFLSNAALIVTLLLSATLSVQAKEVANYVQDHSSQSNSQLLVAAAGADKKDHGDTSSDQGFISQRTTALEFTFAIMTIIVGLIASDRYQRNIEQQQIALGENNGKMKLSIDDQSEHQDKSRMS